VVVVFGDNRHEPFLDSRFAAFLRLERLSRQARDRLIALQDD